VTYGLQLKGTANVSNTNKIQQFQNIALINAGVHFITNYTLHKDILIRTVTEEAALF